jgi:hypothetical protein
MGYILIERNPNDSLRIFLKKNNGFLMNKQDFIFIDIKGTSPSID